MQLKPIVLRETVGGYGREKVTYGMEVNDKKILIIVPAPKKKDKHLPRTLAHREPSLQYIMYTRNAMIWAARERAKGFLRVVL